MKIYEQQKIILKTSGKKGVSVIILVFSLFAIVGLSALVLDLGLIINQRHELQKAVESSALQAVSEYELYESDRNTANDYRLRLPDNNSAPYDDTKIRDVANSYYKSLKNFNQLLSIGVKSEPSITFNKDSRAIMVEVNATFPTYFISIFGIPGIEVQAKAAAVNVPVYLSERFPRPTGSIINGLNGPADPGVDYRDTHIRPPLGWDTSAGAHPTGTVFNRNSDFNNIYGRPDGKSLSLGPGGYVTIKLPATIYDGKGADFIIYERGHAEGYFVYAGVDADPADPYIDALNTPDPDSGKRRINWINISCTGIPLYARLDDDEMLGAHRTQVIRNGVSYTDYKFYGSGLFDLGAKCVNAIDGTVYDGTDSSSSIQIKNIKYLKIIDDNIEDGFFLQPRLDFINHPSATPVDTPHAIPMIIPGEHSTFTPGADLDSIEILHHSRLIRVADFAIDTDGDRLIDIVERIHGLNPNNIDTDGDGWDDLTELEGDEPETAYGYNDSPQDETRQDDVITLYKEYPHHPYHPPSIIINP